MQSAWAYGQEQERHGYASNEEKHDNVIRAVASFVPYATSNKVVQNEAELAQQRSPQTSSSRAQFQRNGRWRRRRKDGAI